MRRLAALIIGVATAQPDIDAACRRPTYPDRYVVMLSAFEQMNKNIGVVAEVASWAKKLGRTFVEPLYCRSRVAPPFASAAETGLGMAVRVQAAHDLRGVDWTCRGQAKVPLSAARDVRQACRTVPMISAAAFLGDQVHVPGRQQIQAGPWLMPGRRSQSKRRIPRNEVRNVVVRPRRVPVRPGCPRERRRRL